MKKILFLHGFFATGSCPMARALKEAFEGTAVVLTPDLTLHPKEALKEIRSIITGNNPTCFWATAAALSLPRCWLQWWAFLPCSAIRIS